MWYCDVYCNVCSVIVSVLYGYIYRLRMHMEDFKTSASLWFGASHRLLSNWGMRDHF